MEKVICKSGVTGTAVPVEKVICRSGVIVTVVPVEKLFCERGHRDSGPYSVERVVCVLVFIRTFLYIQH